MNLLLRRHYGLISTTQSQKKLLCILLSIIYAMGFTPYSSWILSILSLSIFINFTSSQNNPSSFLKLSNIFFFTHFSLSSYWIINTFQVVIENPTFSFLTGLTFTIIIAGLMSTITSIFLFPAWFLHRKFKFGMTVYCLIISILFMGSEIFRSSFLSGLPMHLLSYTVGNNDSLLQIASHIKSYGLSGLLFFISALIGLHRFGARLGAAIIIAVYILGYLKLYFSDIANHPEKSINVRLVNGNYSQNELLKKDGAYKIVDRYIALSERKSNKKIDLIIWPESVLQFYINGTKNSDKNKLYLNRFLKEDQTIITGGPRMKFGDNKNPIYFTSMLAIDKHGGVISYDKHKLVPWGEFIPYRDKIPINIANLFDIKDYKHGTGPLAINLESGLKILPLLCAEGHFPEMIFKHKNDQDLIIMIGNEAWLEGTSEPYQYYINAKFRAVESGLPVLLVSNKGYSAIIDKYGITKDFIYRNSPSILDGSVKIQ